MHPVQPIDVRALFPSLYEALFELLDGLDNNDWTKPTVAGAWTVRGVAAHLLDGDVRRLHRLIRSTVTQTWWTTSTG